MNRTQLRAQNRTIKKHQDHGKLIQPLDGTDNRWARVICECGVHIGWLDQEEWQHLLAFDQERDRQVAEITRLHNYLYNSKTIVKDHQ